LYSDNPLIHDRITQVPGSHKRTLHSLELLRKYGIETRVEMVVMKANQDTVEATLVLRKAMGYKGRNPDPLRPSGRGDSSVNQPDDIHLVQYGFTLRPNFKASKEKIAHFRSGNPCLLGKLAITEFGDILPCIFAREHRIGNYAGLDSLCEVINSPRLQKIWHMTKDDVYVCRDCEYRYVCFDCRPLAEKVANGRSDFQSAPYPRCTYNPYTGQWGTGVWMLDRQGEPYYDQSLSAEIIHVRQSMERS